MRKITRVIIHHTVTSRDATVADIDRMHKRRNWGSASVPYWASKSPLGYYVQYHYLITSDGKVTQCQEEKTASWHAGNANFDSIGVCMTGNFQNEMPTKKQQDSLRELLLKKGLSIQLHRDVKATACPGKNITMEWVNNLLSKMEKTYYIKSELRNELKKIWSKFDHESKSSQEKMAGKLEEYIDELSHALNTCGTVLEDSSKNNAELIIENKTLFEQNRTLILAQDKLSKAHDLELKRTKESLTANYKEQLRLKNNELEENIENAQDFDTDLEQQHHDLTTVYSNRIGIIKADYKKKLGLKTWGDVFEAIREIILKKLNINMKK